MAGAPSNHHNRTTKVFPLHHSLLTLILAHAYWRNHITPPPDVRITSLIDTHAATSTDIMDCTCDDTQEYQTRRKSIGDLVALLHKGRCADVGSKLATQGTVQ